MGRLGVLVSKCYQHSDLFLCSLFFIFLLLAILQPLCKLTRGVFSLRVVIINLSVSQKKKKQNKIGNKKLGYHKILIFFSHLLMEIRKHSGLNLTDSRNCS